MFYMDNLAEKRRFLVSVGVQTYNRPHNLREIEFHVLFEYITMIEGSSIEPETIQAVKHLINPGEKIFVILDSNHSPEDVLAELRANSRIVSVGSYIVAMDGIMEEVTGALRTQPDWTWNNPRQAALEFVKENPDFEIELPPFIFNESPLSHQVTYWPSGYIKRVC